MIKFPPILLASKSPRRSNILSTAGISYRVYSIDTEEIPPKGVAIENIPERIALEKAEVVKAERAKDEVILSADTVVVHDGKIYGKPKDLVEAKSILKILSGSIHSVITGVCLHKGASYHLFHDITRVHFVELSEQFIDDYVSNYEPLDKAGAYAIQEPIGMIGISKLEGSYLNVMGLPLSKIALEMREFSS